MPLVGQSAWNDAIFIASSTILLAVLLGLFRTACSCPAISPLMARLKAAIKAIRTWDGLAFDEVDIIVREKLQKQKVEHFRKFFQILSIALAPFSLILMLSILNRDVRNFTPAQDVIYILAHGIATLIFIHPGILSWRTLDLFYTINVLLLGAFSTPLACRPEFLVDVLQVGSFGMAVMTFLRRTSTPLVPILNLLAMSAACSSIWVHGERVFPRPTISMGLQFLSVTFVTGIAHMLEKGSVAMMRQCLEIQATKELLSAACKLLRSYCVVVVELDSEGVIISPATDLGSFLLRGPGQCLQGRKLADLMEDEADRRKFSDQLGAQTPDSMSFVQALHISMKDGNGDILKLELLWFHFRRLDGQPCYMVGIREFCDAVASSRQHQVQDTEDLTTNDDMAISEDEEGFSLPETASVSASSLGELAAVAVVDASEDGLPIRGLSSGFCMRIGRLSNATHLTRFVRNGDRFTSWVQRSLNAICTYAAVEDRRVRLRMPQGEMQATCRVLLDKSSSGSGDSREGRVQEHGAAIDITRVRLLFSGIRLCHSRGMYGEVARNQGPSQLKGTPVSLMNL